MLIHHRASSHTPSKFFLFTLVISLVIHAAIVWWAPSKQSPIASGNSSRMNVSMRQSELAFHETITAKTEVLAKKDKSEKTEQAESKLNPDSKPNTTQKSEVVQNSELPQNEPAEAAPKKTEGIRNPNVTVAKTENITLNNQPTNTPVQTALMSAKPAQKQTKETLAKQTPTDQELTLANNVNQNKQNDATQAMRYKLGSENNPQPSYPPMARKRGWQGEVVLGVHVRADGSIEHLTFVKSTDYAILNYEAFETVRTSWQFSAIKSDDPENSITYIEVPFIFSIANR